MSLWKLQFYCNTEKKINKFLAKNRRILLRKWRDRNYGLRVIHALYYAVSGKSSG